MQTRNSGQHWNHVRTASAKCFPELTACLESLRCYRSTRCWRFWSASCVGSEAQPIRCASLWTASPTSRYPITLWATSCTVGLWTASRPGSKQSFWEASIKRFWPAQRPRGWQQGLWPSRSTGIWPVRIWTDNTGTKRFWSTSCLGRHAKPICCCHCRREHRPTESQSIRAASAKPITFWGTGTPCCQWLWPARRNPKSIRSSSSGSSIEPLRGSFSASTKHTISVRAASSPCRQPFRTASSSGGCSLTIWSTRRSNGYSLAIRSSCRHDCCPECVWPARYCTSTQPLWRNHRYGPSAYSAARGGTIWPWRHSQPSPFVVICLKEPRQHPWDVQRQTRHV